MHLGFDINDIRTYDINLVVYKKYNDTTVRSINGCVRNMFDGFMKCIKLPNKKICDICNNKKKWFRQCAKCKNNMC